MQKNLYYRKIHGRNNMLKDYFYSFFQSFASYPRLLIEVFIRKDFGERYFMLSSAVTIFTILSALPFLIKRLADLIIGYDFPAFSWTPYITYYVYLAAFLYMSIQHDREKKRNPTVFNFKRFSLSNGTVHPFFKSIQLPIGRKTDRRIIETLLEPGVFFLAGLLLWLFGQALGTILIISSIFYSFSYIADYRHGDNFIMDKIDQMICNEELKDAFLGNDDNENPRGFRFAGRKPESVEMRRQILPLITEDDEDVPTVK